MVCILHLDYDNVKGYNLLMKYLKIILNVALVCFAGFIFYSYYRTYTTLKNIQTELQICKENKSTTKVTRIPILLYHTIREADSSMSILQADLAVSPLDFGKQMDYIKQSGYTTLTFSELAYRIDNNIALPEKSVIITFDDAHRTVYSEAFDVLKKNGQKAVTFVITDNVGTSGYMNKEQLSEMVTQNVIEVGSHSVTHQRMADIPTEQMISELTQSKTILESLVMRPVIAFAYPYGNFSDGVVRELKFAKYRFAVTTESIMAEWPTESPYLMPRVFVYRGMPFTIFRTYLNKMEYTE